MRKKRELGATRRECWLVASDVDTVEKNQMGGEKPVLLIGSPMCCITVIKSQNVVERRVRCPGGQGVITTMMRDANRVSKVKYKNFVEQCETPRDHLSHRFSCKNNIPAFPITWNISFSSRSQLRHEDVGGTDVRETQSELRRFQLTLCSPRRGSCFESKSGYLTEELSMCCCNKDERTKTHVKSHVDGVQRSEEKD